MHYTQSITPNVQPAKNYIYMGPFIKKQTACAGGLSWFYKTDREMSLAVGLRSRVTGAVVESCQLLFYSPTPRRTAKCPS